VFRFEEDGPNAAANATDLSLFPFACHPDAEFLEYYKSEFLADLERSAFCITLVYKYLSINT
jgi:hypothetical protein